LHLERVYPAHGAPYLRAVAPPTRADGPKRDSDAEKLIAWLLDNMTPDGATEDGIARRRAEYGLSERAARSALARLVKAGSMVASDERQYGDRGRMVTRFRLANSKAERPTHAA
jgi:predicted ArsR family transcriptional regulator